MRLDWNIFVRRSAFFCVSDRRVVLALGALGLGLPVCGAAEPARYELDPEHVTVAFLVSHIGFARVLGHFGDVEGTFVFDEESGALADLSIDVATASVATHHAARDEHLRGEDFLDSRSHPAMTFTANSATRTGERTFDVTGTLELLGVSRPLTLHATWNKSGAYPIGRGAHAIGVSARGTLRRSDYGMTYGLDNGWVGDEVEIIIELEARRR